MSLHHTLLLDQGFQPVKLISWQRALCLSFLGKVEVVSSHSREVRTVSRVFPVPAVVRLLKHVRTGAQHVRFSRQNVYVRDGYRCQYCLIAFAPRELTMDHVVPRALGGRTTWANIVTACVHCNRRKGGRTPEQAGLRLQSSPCRPNWISPRTLQLGFDQVPEIWRDWLH